MEVGYIPRSVMYTAELGAAFHISVQVNGKTLQALLDSGCKQSVIQGGWVTPDQLMADITVHTRGRQTIPSGCSHSLPPYRWQT